MPFKAIRLVAFGVLVVSQPLDGQQPNGRGEVVIDSAALNRGGGLSLAEFLVARVPGLIVTYSTGNPHVTPTILTATATGRVGPTYPLLFVDGVLMGDDPQASAVPGSARSSSGTYSTSLGWEMSTDEMAEIRVQLGPSASGPMPLGAARGAVFVTTKRASATPAGVRGTIAHVRVEEPEFEIDPNYGRFYATNPALYPTCAVLYQVPGPCAGGVVAASPYRSPFDASTGVEASVAGRATIATVPVRASVHVTALGGQLPDATRRTTELALAADQPHATPQLGWRASMRHMQMESRDVARDHWSPLATAFDAGPFPDSAATRYSTYLAAWQDRAIPQRQDRTSAELSADLALGSHTQMALRAATSRANRTEHSTYARTNPADTEEERAWGATTTQLTAAFARRDTANARVTLEHDVTVAWWRMNQTERSELRDVVGGISAAREQRRDVDVTSGAVASRVHLPQRASVGAGLRVEHRASDMGYEGATHFVFADARGELRPNLTIRAAFGQADEQRLLIMEWGRLTTPGILASTLQPEHSREWTVGLNAMLSPRADLDLSHRIHSVSNGAMLLQYSVTPPFGIPSSEYTLLSELAWRAQATILSATLHSRAESAQRWTLTGTVVHRTTASRGTKDGYTVYTDGSQRIFVGKGRSISTLTARRYEYADTTGDGVIDVFTFPDTSPTPAKVVGVTEAPWILTARGDWDITRDVRAGFALESRLGHVAVDGQQYNACRALACAAAYDASTSLANQAKAAPFRTGSFIDYVHRADFLKLRELYLEAVFSERGPVRVRFSVQNLLRWTRFPHGDPETVDRFGPVSSGIVFNGTPVTPSVSVRLTFGN